MAPTFSPTTPAALPRLLVGAILARPLDRPARVAVDGPPCAAPDGLVQSMAGVLRQAGREPIIVQAADFWRDASVRFEFGRHDVDSYFDGWLDRVALRREVLLPLGPGGDRRYLPALRDPASNRSVRTGYLQAAADAVLLVAGDLLLGRELPFDQTIHLAVSPAARRRRTPPEWAWTLVALDRYDAEVGPGAIADTVVSWNDPAHPAVRL